MNIKNFLNNKVLFLLIILLAIVLRFYQLGNVPPSPDWDEASLGYNAYSIMQTGKDEYGKTFPVIFRSFDDYKPGLYAYLIIPFISLFDLSIFAVRFPAALFGVLGVIGAYFLVRELFKNKHSEALALLSAFLLAISPWHLQFSRIAFEAQVGMVLNLFSVLFFLKGLKNGAFLLPSALLAAFSIYMYQSEKVYLPLILGALLLIYWKDLIKIPKKWIMLSILLGLLACMPMLVSLFSDQNALSRAKGVSVFSDQTVFLKKNVQKIVDDKNRGDLLGQVLDNRRIEFVKAVVAGYISHFNPNWLFINGDIERHHAPGMGLLYLFELPLLLLGIYLLVFGGYPLKTKLTIFAILLIAPIPASVTSGVPHAVRTINFLPTFQIMTAIGAIGAMTYISNIKYKISNIPMKYLIFSMYIIFLLFNFSYYINQYFVQQNYYYSEYWQYGYQQAIDFVKPIKDNYKKVVVSNKAPLDQSYMFFLYYLKFDPKTYQRLGGTGTGGFAEKHSGFDKFTFRPVDWDKEESGTLIIGRPEDIPGKKILQTIKFLNGKEVIIIAEKR